MRRFLILAAIAALPTPLLAEQPLMRQLGAIPASMENIGPGTTVLSLTVAGDFTGMAPRHRPSSGRVTGGVMRVVMVDGQLMQVNEMFLREQIASGALAVVYPGSNTRWNAGTPAPAYPPAWFEDGLNG